MTLGKSCCQQEKEQTNEFSILKSLNQGLKKYILVGNMEIDPAPATDYLHLITNNNLSFSKHLVRLLASLAVQYFSLGDFFFLNTDILLLACYGCFFLHIYFAVPIWGYENVKCCIYLSYKREQLE